MNYAPLLEATWLTLRLAACSTALLLLGAPLGWWLARSEGRAKPLFEAIIALPLVLPPTVIGFYLLLAFAPHSPLGGAWETLTGSQLAFSFSALVIGSVIYSLPFVVQPLQASFSAIPQGLLEAARTLGAGRLDRLTSIVWPLSRPGFLAAASLGFAHTVGEFGVVLMIGGNIPGRTQVLSIALYEQVELLNYPAAHVMALGLMAASLILLVLLYSSRRGAGWRPSHVALKASIRFSRGDWSLNVGLQTPASGISAIFGPSGCGKTTLLRVIAGLERGDAGTRIQFRERCWQGPDTLLPAERRGVGYVFQDGRLFPHLRVIDNLRYAHRRRFNTRGPAIEDVGRWLQIDGLWQRWPAELSGGQQRRVAIARALVSAPHLLLLDEPLSGLDADNRERAMGLLEGLHRRLALPVLYVSHSLEEVMRLADRVLLMREGALIEEGNIEQLSTSLSSPLCQQAGAAAVLEGSIVAHDHAFGLSQVDVGGLTLSLAETAAPPGTRVRLRIPAASVSLSRSRADDSSIVNIVPARVDAWEERSRTHAMVRLSLGNHCILALITRQSLCRLQLQRGESLFAQIKGVSLLSDRLTP